MIWTLSFFRFLTINFSVHLKSKPQFERALKEFMDAVCSSAFRRRAMRPEGSFEAPTGIGLGIEEPSCGIPDPGPSIIFPLAVTFALFAHIIAFAKLCACWFKTGNVTEVGLFGASECPDWRPRFPGWVSIPNPNAAWLIEFPAVPIPECLGFPNVGGNVKEVMELLGVVAAPPADPHCLGSGAKGL